MSDLRRAWRAVRRRLPARLRRLRLRRCPLADAEHRARGRQFMHVFHRRGAICFAAAARRLALPWQVGLLVHEVGHVAAGRTGGESAAQRHGARVTRIPVRYRGPRRLEWSPVRFARRPR